MANSKAKYSKFCIGAIFIIIGASWLLIEGLSYLDSYVPKALETYYNFLAFECIVSAAAFITFSVFTFLKKDKLALALPAFGVALGALLGIISSVVYLNVMSEWMGMATVSGLISLFPSVLADLSLLTIFVAIGVAALIPQSGAVRAMKILSLIFAIIYVCFASLGLLTSAYTLLAGYAVNSIVFLLSFVHLTMLYVGVLLARSWCFKFIAETAEPGEISEEELLSDFGFEADDEVANDQADALSDAQADAAETAEPAPVAEPTREAEPATSSLAQSASVAPVVTIKPMAKAPASASKSTVSSTTSAGVKGAIKLCVGAIFLLVYAGWLLIDIFDWAEFLDFYYLSTMGVAGIFSNLVTIGTIVALSIIIFMKKKGLPLAITSFSFALGTLVNIICYAIIWLVGDSYNALESWNGYSASDELVAYRVFFVFAAISLLATFVAVGISALLSKFESVVKSMRIISLVCAILYIFFASVAYIIDLSSFSDGFTGLFMLLGFTFTALYYVGIMLTRSWCFKFIAATAEPITASSDIEASAESEPVSAPVASAVCAPAVVAEPVAVAAPAIEVKAVPVVEAKTAPASEVKAKPVAKAKVALAIEAKAEPVAAPVSAPQAEVAPAARASAVKSTALDAQDIASQLRTYKALLDDGIITAEEFDAKKKEILASN